MDLTVSLYYLLLTYFIENIFYLQNLCGGYFTIGFSCKRHHMLWKKILTKRYMPPNVHGCTIYNSQDTEAT